MYELVQLNVSSIFSLLLILLVSVFYLFSVKNTETNKEWIFLSLIGLVFLSTLKDLWVYVDGGYLSSRLLRGWVGPAREISSIRIGFVKDGFSIFGLSFITVMVFLECLSLNFYSATKMKKTYAIISLAFVGLSLVFLSATPWTAFLGMILMFAANFLFFFFSNKKDSIVSGRSVFYTWIPVFALLIQAFGFSLLVAQSINVDWKMSAELFRFGEEIDLSIFCIFVGSFLSLSSPILQNLFKDDEDRVQFSEIIMTQVFPAFAQYVLLYRTFLLFFNSPVWVFCAWAFLFVGALAAVIALFRSDRTNIFRFWFSALVFFSIAVLSFGSNKESYLFFMGGVFYSLLYFWRQQYLDYVYKGLRLENPNKNVYIFTMTVFALACTSSLGFVGSDAVISWTSKNLENKLVLVATSSILFLMNTAFWKQFWILINPNTKIKTKIVDEVLFLFFGLFGTSLLWTGYFSVIGASASSQSVISSFFLVLLKNEQWSELIANAEAVVIVMGLTLFSLFISFWLKSKWQTILSRLRFVSLVSSNGFYVSIGFLKAKDFQVMLYEAVSGFFKNIVLKKTNTALQSVVKNTSYYSESLHRVGSDFVYMRISDLMSKIGGLGQAIQNGKIQWYLLFGFFGAAILLLYFIKFVVDRGGT